jgi:CBS domain-containing protein
MYVKDIMTKKIFTVDCNKTIRFACDIYCNNKIGCLIVTENNNIVGIVTERDLIERTLCGDRDPKIAKIKEIMSTNIITIDHNERVEKAIGILKENKIKKLPVTANNTLVGIITITDIAYSRPTIKEFFSSISG